MPSLTVFCRLCSHMEILGGYIPGWVGGGFLHNGLHGEQPRPQGFSLKKWVREKPWGGGCTGRPSPNRDIFSSTVFIRLTALGAY